MRCRAGAPGRAGKRQRQTPGPAAPHRPPGRKALLSRSRSLSGSGMRWATSPPASSSTAHAQLTASASLLETTSSTCGRGFGSSGRTPSTCRMQAVETSSKTRLVLGRSVCRAGAWAGLGGGPGAHQAAPGPRAAPSRGPRFSPPGAPGDPSWRGKTHTRPAPPAASVGRESLPRLPIAKRQLRPQWGL
jgi:hypothetical protein